MLAKNQNEDADFQNYEQYQTALNEIDYSDIISMAVALKVAAEMSDSEGAELPEGITSLADLINDFAAAYNYQIQVADTSAYDSAFEEVMNDPIMVQPISFDVPKQIHPINNHTLVRALDSWSFSDAGTGQTGENLYTWSKQGNTISGQFTYAVPIISYPSIDTMHGSIQVEQTRTIESFELTITRIDDLTVDALIKENVAVTYSPEDLNAYPELISNSTETSLSAFSGLLPSNKKTMPNVSGKTAYLPIKHYETYDDVTGSTSVSAERFTFSETLTAKAQNISNSQWSVSNDTLSINYLNNDLDQNTVLTYEKMSDGEHLNYFAVTSHQPNTGTAAGKGKIIISEINWDVAEVPGIYKYPNTLQDNGLDYFWFELKANGDADTISTSDSNLDGELSADEVFMMYGSWSIIDGEVVITRVRNKLTWEYSPEHRVADGGDWAVFHERRWDLISTDENTLSLFHTHSFKYGAMDSVTYPAEYEINYFDIRDLEKTNSSPVDISAFR